MLITDKNELKNYYSEHRLWQGIPALEITKGGRMFCAFYSGGVKEEIGNFVVLLRSDDKENFSQPIAALYKEGYRCFDPCLWIDPLGRLWLIWSVMPHQATYAVICDNPDAEELMWGDEFLLGHDVMMNKPTVLSTGEWMFPIAVWEDKLQHTAPDDDIRRETGAFVYKSIDNGKSFVKYGGTRADRRSFDEHMILEKNDGTLAMYIRTFYGIAVSYSYDSGKTWSKSVDSGIASPSSRFFIRRLKSGKILLVNHYDFDGRNNLTAMLSEDDGKTWNYRLLLDERKFVSYPDAVETENGDIYIVYDRERGGYKSSVDEVYASAREILYAKITEEDIINGKVSEESRIKYVISKLGKYSRENENPFGEYNRYTDEEFAELLYEKYSDCIAEKIFENYPMNCADASAEKIHEFDRIVETLAENKNDLKIITRMVSIARSVSKNEGRHIPVVDAVKETITKNVQNDLTVREIAAKIGISESYMMYIFKKTTGITITEYKNNYKISMAKKMLVEGDKSLTDIAQLCGFGSSSYFTKLFTRNEGVTPSQYRENLKRN